MTIILFHSGNTFPPFIGDCLKQLRLYHKNIPIHFLTDHRWVLQHVFVENDIFVIDKDKYFSEDINIFEMLYTRGKDDFWTITSTRLFYLKEYITKMRLENVYHLENDVLLYHSLWDLNPVFRSLYQNIAITFGGPNKAMTGLMFIRKPSALAHLTDFILNLMKTRRLNDIKRDYDMDMVNEMTLMRAYSKEYPERMIPLPTLPFGDWSLNYDKFNSIFDPASWGQYVGGTQSDPPGAKPDDHYIGLLLRQHPEYDVVWHEEKKGKVPYFKYDGQEIKINNLHIHSKNLHLYTSR